MTGRPHDPHSALRRALRTLGPAVARPALREVLRAAFGTGLGVVAVGTLTRLTLHPDAASATLWFAAPLGATAFLAFSIPNSPLAQPWSAIVGNTVSALVGIAVVLAVAQPYLAAALAVGLAITAMMALRAMHPPGAAVALGIALSPPVIRDAGFGYALSPILLDTALLIGLAILYNRATGRVYPFRQPPELGPHGTTDRAPQRRLGLSPESLATILQRFNMAANVGTEDLARLIAAAEAEATARHLGDLTCADMMSRDLVTIRPETPLTAVAELFRKHRFKTLPVTGPDNAFRGLLSAADLVGHPYAAIAGGDAAPQIWTDRNRQAIPATAAHILQADVPTVPPETPLARLLARMDDGRQQAVPVVAAGRLVGLVTRSDLISALARALRSH